MWDVAVTQQYVSLQQYGDFTIISPTSFYRRDKYIFKPAEKT